MASPFKTKQRRKENLATVCLQLFTIYTPRTCITHRTEVVALRQSPLVAKSSPHNHLTLADQTWNAWKLVSTFDQALCSSASRTDIAVRILLSDYVKACACLCACGTSLVAQGVALLHTIGHMEQTSTSEPLLRLVGG